MANKNVNEMPYSTRRKLCEMLDVGQQWKMLAEEIGLNVDKIQSFELCILRPSQSPTSELLTYWSHSNATVEMLCLFLLKLKLQRAADLLRGMVPDEVFNTGSRSLNSNKNNNFKKEPEQRSLPNPSQAVGEMELPLPSFLRNNGAPNNKPCKETTTYERESCSKFQDWEPEKMNITMQNADMSRTCQKPTSYGKNARPLDTCSENLGSSETFHPNSSNSSRKSSQTLPSKNSYSNARVPVESPDVPESSLKGSSSSHKAADSVTLSSIMICYRYVDIVAATNTFSEDNLLGRGGFGVVYRGNIKKTTFAIKILHKRENPVSSRDFLAEINSLLKYRQKNIIMLSGCSIDGPAVCLVYEFMVNGSLQDRLDCKNNTKPLPWMVRHSILKDAAAGLQYLHTVDDKPLIHGDIKTANILLGPHYEAKVSDFGLAKEATGGTVTGKLTHVTRNDFDKVYGSRAYLPEDFFTGGFQFNIKTDTYSFGIVIFETCTGERPDDPRREGGRLLNEYVRNVMVNNRNHLVTIKDKKSPGWPDELWLQVMSLGIECTSETKKERPHMTEVYGRLETLHQEMQLKHKICGKLNGSEDGSFSQPPSFTASEKSYRLSHQSMASPDHSLAAGNTMMMEEKLSPVALQNAYDKSKQKNDRLTNSILALPVQNESSLMYACSPKKVHEFSEDFAELSISEDGSKKAGFVFQTPTRHAVISDDRENEKSIKCLEVETHNYKSDFSSKFGIHNRHADAKHDSFLGGGSSGSFPSECLQNFANEKKECLMPENSFLAWKNRQEEENSLLIPNVYHDPMILSEELEHIKKKKLPDEFDDYYNNENLDDDNDFEQEEDGVEHQMISQMSGVNESAALPYGSYLTSSLMLGVDGSPIHFVPPTADESLGENFSVFERNKDSISSPRQPVIAREDLLRAEKLERLRKLRHEQQ